LKSNRSNTVIEATPLLNQIAPTGTFSGETYQLAISGSEGFWARNLASNQFISAVTNGQNAEGNGMAVRKTIPTFTKEPVTNDLLNGSTELYRWTVSASEGNIVDLARLGYGVNLIDLGGQPLALSQFQLSRDGVPLIPADEGPNTFRVYELLEGGDAPVDLTNPDNSLVYDELNQGVRSLCLVFYGYQDVEPYMPAEYSLCAVVSGAGMGEAVLSGFLGEIYPEPLTGEVVLWPEPNNGWGPLLDPINQGMGQTAVSTLWSDYSGTYGDNVHIHGSGSLDWASGWELGGCFGPVYWNTQCFPGLVAAADVPAYTTVMIFPNPFNPATTVTVNLPLTGQLVVSVFDVLGRQVAELANGQFSAGHRVFTLDGSSLSSGVYFVRVNSARVSMTQRITLMK
ncbi:MAG TPA: hypothetical protein DEP92_03435, partial [Candidatus Komeilibacteria bacterium]|nr:hypothetical protein [Candidatus Komeilibacteria bacterium]